MRGTAIDSGKRVGRLLVLFESSARHDRSKYWCICDCGKTILMERRYLNSGNAKSCGCLRDKRFLENRTVKHYYERGFIRVYNSYKTKAKARNYEFLLDMEQFNTIINMNCHYCNAMPKISMGYRHNGIDRVDNTKGYTSVNVVPCCKWCNQAKSTMTLEEFKTWIKAIYKKTIGDL